MKNKHWIHITLAFIALITASLACGRTTDNQTLVDDAVQSTLAAIEVTPDDQVAEIAQTPDVVEADATEEQPVVEPTVTPTVPRSSHRVATTHESSLAVSTQG